MSDEPENMEMLFHGPKGDRGARGERGEEGALPRRARRSLLARDIVIIVLLLLNFLFTAKYVDHSQSAQQAQQAAAQRASAAIIRKVCGGFGELAAEKPPAGNPKTNPSRAFDDGQHMILTGIGADLCRADSGRR